jgi:2,3-bisphosphoglycerate-independent phosphoglycerate mutase
MMEKSYELLKYHTVNLERINRGLNPANSTWIWGEGKKPSLASFKDKYGVDGSVISAVDLIQGIGILAGLTPIKVEGATGTIHTNFDGKAQAAIDALKAGDDFIYIHLEAPDECGHQGDLEGKIKSIESSGPQDACFIKNPYKRPCSLCVIRQPEDHKQ